MIKRWAGWAVINFFVVSLLGVILRYKSACYLPYVNYKYLLNAHSHFAFAGWVTTALYTILLFLLVEGGGRLRKAYQYIFIINQVANYGMLASFSWQGYGPVSIVFSSLSVLVSYWFTILYWYDARTRTQSPAIVWSIRLALSFLVLSSLGPYLLAYSMSHALGNMTFYYNAIYLYLHFQYNGWFTFGVLAIFFWWAQASQLSLPRNEAWWVVAWMGAACLPAYSLSLLWADPPRWVWALALLAAVMQVIALWWMFKIIRAIRHWSSGKLTQPVKLLWGLAMLALTIKLILQLGSVVPALGRLAFGFRPVVIAYLHLVLLGFVSFFLLGFLIVSRLIPRPGKMALGCFVAGVVANEAILLLQSLLTFAGRGWVATGYFLLGAALLIATGLGIIVYGTK